MKATSSRPTARRKRVARSVIAFVLLLFADAPELLAREWAFVGIPQPMEAEFIGMKNGGVVLQGSNGKSFEVPFTSFTPEDQKYLKLLEAGGGKIPAMETPSRPITTSTGYSVKSVATLADEMVTLKGGTELHVTGGGEPISGSKINFTASDAWLIFDNVAPSKVAAKFLSQMRVNGEKAAVDTNIRVVQYGAGTVIIPQAADFPAMTVYASKDLSGSSLPLKCYEAYAPAKLLALKGSIRSFVLRRGYMATLAQKENGTGASVNYVAQDHDVVVNTMPQGLDTDVRFIRIFPWRWVSKKGVGGALWQNLNVGWFYDWNIGTKSSLDHEYVGISQNRWWPSLDQDWKAKSITHLLGFNEPDHKDQANMAVEDAINAWPGLLATGLRLGSPATSDGGQGWLYKFLDKADATGLRVDFVALHYYHAIANPDDAKGAASQFYQSLKAIHDRVRRPLWITEWNNGANWTHSPKPNDKQQKAAIAAMTKMLDETPFVERYAPFNWVEDCRQLVRKDGSLTLAGEVYRDKKSPLAYLQAKAQK